MKFTILHNDARTAIKGWIDKAPVGYQVILKPGSRTIEQNDKLWPMLRDISEQVNWYDNKLTEWEWKDVFTAALKRSKVVPGIDGGFVIVGAHTSRYTKSEMSELLSLIEAFAADHGVIFNDTHG